MKPGMKMMIAQTAGTTRPKQNENRRMIGFYRDEMRERTREYPIPNDNRDPNGRADSPKREYMPYPPLKREEEAYSAYGAYGMENTNPYMPRQNYSEQRMPQQMYPSGNRMMGGYAGNEYGDIYASGTIYAPGAMNKGAQREEKHQLDEQSARKWVKRMTGGEIFKIEQTEHERLTLCPECEKWDFYAIMNAMHSDHNESVKRLGVDRPEAYAMFAKDFIKDKDAVDHKIIKYMEYIAK